MFQRLAARPLALTAALLLFVGCDDEEDDGSASPTATDPGSTGDEPSSASTGDGTTTGEDTTTGDEGSTSGSSAESSTGIAEGSSGGGEDTDSTGEAAVGYVDLAGDYIEPFPGGMTLHTLSAETWVVDYGTGPIPQSVVQIDDEAQWVVLEDDMRSTYSRNDWAFDDDGVLRYCTGAFGSETAEAAIAAPMSDANDLDGTGCGGMFPWSALEPAA